MNGFRSREASVSNVLLQLGSPVDSVLRRLPDVSGGLPAYFVKPSACEKLRSAWLGLSVCWMMVGAAFAQPANPWLSSHHPLTILSANDGAIHLRLDAEGKLDSVPRTHDSITVIHLGADQPPIVKTVYGEVPNSIFAPPYIAMTGDGRWGFVPSRPAGLGKSDPNRLFVINLASPQPNVVKTFEIDGPSTTVRHPNGKHILVTYRNGIQVYEVRDGLPRLLHDNPLSICTGSIDVHPHGNALIQCGQDPETKERLISICSYRDGVIEPTGRVQLPEKYRSDAHFPLGGRYTPDGKRLVMPTGFPNGSKGVLDDVLVIDMTQEPPIVSDVIPQVADGIESLAIHPGGRFAAIACLDDTPRQAPTPYSHLAVIDLNSRPARLLYHLDLEGFPEGIEFSPDGRQLFVQLTAANRLVVFDVADFRLKRSPFVIRLGHGPSSLAVGPRDICRARRMRIQTAIE